MKQRTDWHGLTDGK